MADENNNNGSSKKEIRSVEDIKKNMQRIQEDKKKGNPPRPVSKPETQWDDRDPRHKLAALSHGEILEEEGTGDTGREAAAADLGKSTVIIPESRAVREEGNMAPTRRKRAEKLRISGYMKNAGRFISEKVRGGADKLRELSFKLKEPRLRKAIENRMPGAPCWEECSIGKGLKVSLYCISKDWREHGGKEPPKWAAVIANDKGKEKVFGLKGWVPLTDNRPSPAEIGAFLGKNLNKIVLKKKGDFGTLERKLDIDRDGNVKGFKLVGKKPERNKARQGEDRTQSEGGRLHPPGRW